MTVRRKGKDVGLRTGSSGSAGSLPDAGDSLGGGIGVRPDMQSSKDRDLTMRMGEGDGKAMDLLADSFEKKASMSEEAAEDGGIPGDGSMLTELDRTTSPSAVEPTSRIPSSFSSTFQRYSVPPPKPLQNSRPSRGSVSSQSSSGDASNFSAFSDQSSVGTAVTVGDEGYLGNLSDTDDLSTPKPGDTFFKKYRDRSPLSLRPIEGGQSPQDDSPSDTWVDWRSLGGDLYDDGGASRPELPHTVSEPVRAGGITNETFSETPMSFTASSGAMTVSFDSQGHPSPSLAGKTRRGNPSAQIRRRRLEHRKSQAIGSPIASGSASLKRIFTPSLRRPPSAIKANSNPRMPVALTPTFKSPPQDASKIVPFAGSSQAPADGQEKSTQIPELSIVTGPAKPSLHRRTSSNTRIHHARSLSRTLLTLGSLGTPSSKPIIEVSGDASFHGIEVEKLWQRLKRARDGDFNLDALRFLVVDTRAVSNYLGPAGRIKGSVNVNFPSLLIKRFRKGNVANFSLDSFITTETGKRRFAKIARAADTNGSALSGLDLYVIDDKLEEATLSDGGNSGAVLLSVLDRMGQANRREGNLFFVKGSFAAISTHVDAREWIVIGEDEGEDEDGISIQTDQNRLSPIAGSKQRPQEEGKKGLLMLQPVPQRISLPRLHASPIISPSGTSPSTPRQDSPGSSQPSPVQPGQSPVSSPGSSGSAKKRPPKLRRIDTSDNIRDGFLHPTSDPSRSRPKSPTPLQLGGLSANFDRPPPPPSARSRGQFSLSSALHLEDEEPPHTAIRSTFGGVGFGSSGRYDEDSTSRLPSTAAPTSGGEGASFEVSTIIPGFLYLGAEPTKESDAVQLENLGVKRIINMAFECKDSEDLRLAQRFEKYTHLDMQDFVEEAGVQARIDQACLLLDDAQLHSKPTYVHCKAGKSRSVTIVLAFLIHRYHWSLKQAYAHVSERRSRISPNIGFVAELMRYEERELGTKSKGVIGTPSPAAERPRSNPTSTGDGTSGVDGTSDNASHGQPSINEEHARWTFGRVARGRESLPPLVGAYPSFSPMVPFSTDQELEVKAENGPWRHARPAPMDSNGQLQRRASKAGLESFR